MSQSEARLYTIDLIYKFYKAPTTNDHDSRWEVRKHPINIPSQQSFLNKFITKNTELLQEFSNRGIGLFFDEHGLPPVSIEKINTLNTIRNGNELLVTIEFEADNGLQELMDDQYQGYWWEDYFEKKIDEITEEDKIEYIFEKFFEDVDFFDNILYGFNIDYFIYHNNEKHIYTGEVKNVKSELLTDLKEAEAQLIMNIINLLKNKIGHVGCAHNIVDFFPIRHLTKEEAKKVYKNACEKIARRTKEEAVKAFQKGGKKSKTRKSTKGATNKTKKKKRRNTV